MKQLFVSRRQLAVRWGMSVHVLKKWHSMGKGPQLSNLCGRLRYRIEDIEECEKKARPIEKIKNKLANE